MTFHTIEQVFDAFRRHLRTRTGCLDCFVKYEYQSEGWLKAEWLEVLDQLKTRGQTRHVDREVRAKGNYRIDLAVDLADGRHWIELKHWYVGSQKGQRWRPAAFISELESECEKFEAVVAGDRAWIAALCTPRPTENEWLRAIRLFNREYRPWRLQSLAEPRPRPRNYLLGVLRVRGLSNRGHG